MKREEIIAMAREAGFPFNKYGLLQGDDEGEIDADDMFCVFTALVEAKAAAKEREACAQICEKLQVTFDKERAPDAIDCASTIRERANK